MGCCSRFKAKRLIIRRISKNDQRKKWLRGTGLRHFSFDSGAHAADGWTFQVEDCGDGLVVVAEIVLQNQEDVLGGERSWGQVIDFMMIRNIKEKI